MSRSSSAIKSYVIGAGVHILKNGSRYRASEFIPCIFGVFKNKIERG